MEGRDEGLRKDMEDSETAFREQFDRSNPNFHGGITAPVPIGGARVPDSMPTEIDPNYHPPAEPDSPEYIQAKDLRTRLGEFKKEIAHCGPLIEKRMQIAEVPEEAKRTELYDRSEAEVADFEGKVLPYIEEFRPVQSLLHVHYADLVQELLRGLRARFDTKEAYSEFAHKLKVTNSKIFKDMTDLLQRMKALKKTAASSN